MVTIGVPKDFFMASIVLKLFTAPILNLFSPYKKNWELAFRQYIDDSLSVIWAKPIKTIEQKCWLRF